MKSSVLNDRHLGIQKTIVDRKNVDNIFGSFSQNDFVTYARSMTYMQQKTTHII